MGFCNDITPSCVTCFGATYGKCNDVFTLTLGLDANTTYFLNLIDKFDIVTQLEVTTDALGSFDITQTWVEFFGDVEIQIFSDSGRITRVIFTQNSISFDCIIASSGGVTSSPIICPLTFDFSFSCNSQYLATL